MCLHGLSVLRFYEDFRKCISNNPTDKNQVHNFLFFHKVDEACGTAGVSPETFATWQSDIKLSFQQKNCFALSLKEAPGMAVDSRPLLQRMGQQEVVLETTGTTCNVLRHEMGELRYDVRELLSLNRQLMGRVARMEDFIATHMAHSSAPPMVPGLAIPDPEEVGNAEAEGACENDGVPAPFANQPKTKICYDNILHQRYKNQAIPMSKLFSSWFLEQLPIAYENYKTARLQNPTSPRMDKKTHTTVKNHFSICKTAVHVVLKNLEKYPEVGDEKSLEVVANEALDKIVTQHGLPSRPSRTKACWEDQFRLQDREV